MNRIMKKQFTKSDLKTGMRVQTRNGDMHIVSLFSNCIVDKNEEYVRLIKYNDRLSHNEALKWDIVKVYSWPIYECESFNFDSKGDLLWEREEVVELIDGEIYCETDARPAIFRHNFLSTLYFDGGWQDAVRIFECTPKPATLKQKAKLIKAEMKNGYLWDDKNKKLVYFKKSKNKA